MSEFTVAVPQQHTASEVLEAAAGLIGVALYRGSDDAQALYDDLGALACLISGARVDLVNMRKVKER